MTDNHDETARRIVAQEVKYCVSHLISEMMKCAMTTGSLINDDEWHGLAYRAPDADSYSDANDAGLGTVVPISTRNEGKQWLAIEIACDSDDVVQQEAFDTELEAWQHLFEETGQDTPEGCEALEHWLVSGWLAAKLRNRGESVVDLESLNLTVWARCTSGQAIYADAVMQDIAADLDA